MNFINNKECFLFLENHFKEDKKNKNFALEKIVNSFLSFNKKEYHNPVENCILLKTIDYKNLDNWDAQKYIGLEILLDKIKYMIRTNKEDSVYVMLKKISTGRIKKISKPVKDKNTIFLGFGHFRWNESAIVLTKTELKILNNILNQ